MLGSWLTQIVTISLFNLRNLKERLGTSAATVVGVAGVVLVAVGVLSVATGFTRTLSATGDPESVLVMRDGSNGEMSSVLTLEETRIVGDGPGVARGKTGVLASAELYVIVDVPKRGDETPANVPLRGVSPAAFEVRRDFELVSGRLFEPGLNEILVGRAAADEFAGLDLGSSVTWGENTWKVVGIFTVDGAENSEIWCDALVLQPAYRRGNTFQSVNVRLQSADAFKAFRDTLTTDPRLSVMVERKDEYFAAQSEGVGSLIRVLGLVIGGLMGFGAVFGALNTMYSAVQARTREIGTLRALGFGASPVVISVLFESLVLAALGGVLGGALAYASFNGVQAATINWQSFSQVAFTFAVTPELLVGGMLYALLMGLVGGLFPSIRAARLPVATALREL